jgi:AraC family transcriptional regulator of adaptative response / DNA-3-methyladenine glycosylase II
MTEIARAAGFGSVRRFNHAFLATYRRPPGALRRGRGPETDADEVVMRLAYRPPYDWDHLRDFLATRAVPGVERVDSRGYARTVATEGGHAVVGVRALAGEHALLLRVRGAAPGALFPLSAAARRMFDLAADPTGIAAAFESDPLLGPLVRRRPGLRIPGAWEPFECVVRAVLGQQVSVAAGRTLAARVVARAGTPVAGGTDGLTHLFPSAAALAGASLEGLGLTGGRIRALHTVARAVVEGRLDLGGTGDEVIAALTALPGFGPWTAQYVALRALGEPDAFPAGDLVLRRAAAPRGEPLTTRALEAKAEAWRPWRGYAVLHLWNAAGPPTRSRPPSARG